MSMVLTPPDPTMEPVTFSLRESMYTTTRPAVASMFPAQSLLTLNPAPWTVSDPDLMDKSSDLTTLFLARAALVTIGPRDITQRVLNLLIPSLMLLGRRLNLLTVCKAFSLHILWEEELDLVWVHFWSPKSARSFLIELWTLTL